jgi:hypothetical protein
MVAMTSATSCAANYVPPRPAHTMVASFAIDLLVIDGIGQDSVLCEAHQLPAAKR